MFWLSHHTAAIHRFSKGAFLENPPQRTGRKNKFSFESLAKYCKPKHRAGLDERAINSAPGTFGKERS